MGSAGCSEQDSGPQTCRLATRLGRRRWRLRRGQGEQLRLCGWRPPEHRAPFRTHLAGSIADYPWPSLQSGELETWPQSGAHPLPGSRLSPQLNESLPGADVLLPAMPSSGSQSKHQAVVLARPRVRASREAERDAGGPRRRAQGAPASRRRPVAGHTPTDAQEQPAPGLLGSFLPLLALRVVLSQPESDSGLKLPVWSPKGMT